MSVLRIWTPYKTEEFEVQGKAERKSKHIRCIKQDTSTRVYTNARIALTSVKQPSSSTLKTGAVDAKLNTGQYCFTNFAMNVEQIEPAHMQPHHVQCQ